jgi:ribosomal protein S18 acetylase RimI-like enzyme
MMWVRTASERDLAAVKTLLAETWHATYDGIYGVERVDEITSDWHSLESLKARLSKPHSEFILCEGENGIAGMAFASQTDPGFVMLRQLYVLPNAQKNGVGSLLLDEIIAAFPDGKSLRVEVEAANAGALAFYQAKGFAQIAATDNCGKDQSGIPALILARSLQRQTAHPRY